MQNNQLNTSGIVIKRFNYKEADKILTIYTKDLGKISCIAKGIRKLSSKKSASLEPFTISKLHLIKSHDFYLITQTTITKSFNNFSDSYQELILGFYILEVFDKLVPIEVENVTLYNFLAKSIYVLSLSANKIQIVNAYNIKILRILGFYISDVIKATDLIEYAKFLEENTYESIVKLKTENTFDISLRTLLVNYTETITESSLKTTNRVYF